MQARQEELAWRLYHLALNASIMLESLGHSTAARNVSREAVEIGIELLSIEDEAV